MKYNADSELEFTFIGDQYKIKMNRYKNWRPDAVYMLSLNDGNNNMNSDNMWLKLVLQVNEMCHENRLCLDALRVFSMALMFDKNNDKFGTIIKINPNGYDFNHINPFKPILAFSTILPRLCLVANFIAPS